MDLDAHMRSQTVEQLKLFEISANFQLIFQAMLFTKFEVFWIYPHINGITGWSAIAIALAYLFICFVKDTMEIFKEKSHNSKNVFAMFRPTFNSANQDDAVRRMENWVTQI